MISDTDKNNIKAAELLNRCSDAINHVRHDMALSLLNEFDAMCSGKALSPDIIHARLKIGSELFFRLGKYRDGIDFLYGISGQQG